VCVCPATANSLFLSFFLFLVRRVPSLGKRSLTTGMIRESQIAVPQKRLIFHPHAQRNAFRPRDARRQSRSFGALESIAETQPQLQPALLRLSAMISQYVRRRILQ
jgi:hypothetical protein